MGATMHLNEPYWTWSKGASSSQKIKPAGLAAAAVDQIGESTNFFNDAQLGVLFK